MHARAHTSQPHARAATAAAQQPLPLRGRALQVAEALSWALMLLGLTAASLVLINSYLLGS